MGRSRHGIIGPDDPSISYMDNIYAAFHRAIKEHVDSLQPHKLNRYVYCYNNPVNLTDPLGLLTDEEYTKMVEWSRDKGYEVAPGNLEYWKSGEGGTRTLDAKYFKENEYVSELTTQYEESKSYRSHVTEKATRLIQQNPDAKQLSGTTDYHEISARFQGGRSGGAGPDLDYGLGSFDIVPRVNFEVTRDSNDPNKLNIEITSVTYHVEDEYNWDKGKGTPVPPLKRYVTDSEMKEYGEKVGAQEYLIRSEKWKSDVEDNYTVTTEGTEKTSGTSQNIPQAETPGSTRTGEVEVEAD